MAIIRWDPFRDINAFQRQFQSMFDENWGNRFAELAKETGLTDWQIKVDIQESPEAYTVRADLPGVKKEDINLHVDNGILSITGKRETVKEEDKNGYHRIERVSGNFRRSFQLPEHVNAQGIAASYQDGVLELRLPKAEKARDGGLRIDVK
ncbi:MAG: hypothetical protein GMKNLPBB_01289 [Myxococcota bacterium]|nr:hypothetical protein [Myxococcota bacterium]